MQSYDVWHQWQPVVQLDGGMWLPAVFYRGTVEADSGEQAIAEAKRLRLSPAPMVKLA